jgi:hypothetical protein
MFFLDFPAPEELIAAKKKSKKEHLQFHIPAGTAVSVLFRVPQGWFRGVVGNPASGRPDWYNVRYDDGDFQSQLTANGKDWRYAAN